MKTRKTFKLTPGEKNIQQGNNEIHISGGGNLIYLWIGGNGCYGTLSGTKTLEAFANSILEAIKDKN